MIIAFFFGLLVVSYVCIKISDHKHNLPWLGIGLITMLISFVGLLISGIIGASS